MWSGSSGMQATISVVAHKPTAVSSGKRIDPIPPRVIQRPFLVGIKAHAITVEPKSVWFWCLSKKKTAVECICIRRLSIELTPQREDLSPSLDLTEMSSTSKISVAFGPMSGPAPEAP
jgi:hypothetical protein